MIGNAFVLAVRQISRNPLRSLLTVLGVVIGVMAVITMVTVGNGASQAIRTQIESFGNNQLMLRPGLRMGPGQSVGAPNFTLEDADALKRQIAGIVAVAPQASKTMTVVANRRNWQTSVIGTDNNYFTIDNREIVDGRTFEQGEMQSGAAVCVIGGTIQKESSSAKERRSSDAPSAREASRAGSWAFSRPRVRPPWAAIRTTCSSCRSRRSTPHPRQEPSRRPSGFGESAVGPRPPARCRHGAHAREAQPLRRR